VKPDAKGKSLTPVVPKAKAKGKSKAKAKGIAAKKSKAAEVKAVEAMNKPVPTVEAVAKKGSGKSAGKGGDKIYEYGCSKCRWMKGCKQCKDPNFKGARFSYLL
jgi:hypothetical protein